jgi:hypothetical protein
VIRIEPHPDDVIDVAPEIVEQFNARMRGGEPMKRVSSKAETETQRRVRKLRVEIESYEALASDATDEAEYHRLMSEAAKRREKLAELGEV